MGLFDRLRGDDVSRVAVIGIDGVPYSLFSSHRDEFENLAAIASAGTAGAIESIVPPDSSAAWPCLTTGQNPGKTGVYGFQDREVGSYDTYVPTANDVQAPRVWDRVQKANRQATVINVPVTFPPQRTVQRMVSGFLSIDHDRAAHPESVAEYLDSIGYRIDVDATLGHDDDKSAFLEDAHDTLETRFQAFKHFIDEDDWDLFFGVFMTPDRINHFLFDQYANEGEYYEEFLAFYRTLDEYIGEIREALPENVTLVVVSDHGFTTLEYEVNCNEWLREEGWLSFDAETDYVVQLNHLLREEGLLSYEPRKSAGDTAESAEQADSSDSSGRDEPPSTPEDVDSSREELPLEAERIESIDLDDFRIEDEPGAVFDETDVGDESTAFAPEPGTVLVFDANQVDAVKNALSGLVAGEGETRLVESTETVPGENGAAATLELTPAAHVKFAVDHSQTGAPVEHARGVLADITDDTRAYSLSPGRFYLNLDGREPRGTVPQSEYDAVREQLRNDLAELEGPDGRPVCDRILDTEDAYRGDHVDIAPDLVVVPNDGYDLKADFTPDESAFSSSTRTGMHTFDDACLFVDDDDARISDADILDVAPTILSLLEIDFDRASFDGASLV